MFWFIIIYIFALIGYFGTGIFIYVNLDDKDFNKIGFFFERFLEKLFYKNNKNDCEYIDKILWYKSCEWVNGIAKYQNKIYYDTNIWNQNYMPFLSIFELLCLVFWPIWILVNLFIGAFYDD